TAPGQLCFGVPWRQTLAIWINRSNAVRRNGVVCAESLPRGDTQLQNGSASDRKDRSRGNWQEQEFVFSEGTVLLMAVPASFFLLLLLSFRSLAVPFCS